VTPNEACRPSPWKFVLVAAYMALIAFLSLVPMDEVVVPEQPPDFVGPLLQNLMHIPAYAALSIILAQVFAQYGRKGAGLIVPALLISVAFGAANEAGQALIPGRYPSLWDGLANLLGAGLGALVYTAAERLAPGRIRRLICS
jgi:VanZ family protein